MGVYIVFAGPVEWTKNMTETELNPTAKDRTTIFCSCTDFENFQLPVPRFDEKWKDQKRPIATSFFTVYIK
jgi:hypothetical protein